jgi:membrane-associated protein
VVAGSSNLYLLSRRYGHRLLEHRLARYLNLDAGRMARAEGWLSRWGAIAVIFGRHIPGFRVPITVMAGVFQIPYRIFAPSVAVSSAIWAGVWLYLAQRYGRSAVHLVTGKTVFVVTAVAIAVAAAIIGVLIWSRTGASADRPEGAVPEDERVARP